MLGRDFKDKSRNKGFQRQGHEGVRGWGGGVGKGRGEVAGNEKVLLFSFTSKNFVFLERLSAT